MVFWKLNFRIRILEIKFEINWSLKKNKFKKWYFGKLSLKITNMEVNFFDIKSRRIINKKDTWIHFSLFILFGLVFGIKTIKR